MHAFLMVPPVGAGLVGAGLIGSVGAVVGHVLMVVANLIHPWQLQCGDLHWSAFV